MKTRIFARLTAALFLTLSTGAIAQRPSTDEVAIRLGVAAWFSGRTALSQAANIAALKALYRPDLEATQTLSDTPRTSHGLPEYAALWQPFYESLASLSAAPVGDVNLSLDGDHAVTTFSFTPQGIHTDGRPLCCGARVSLTWKKHNGLWQIAREEVGPIQASVASDPARATTQR